MNNYHELLKSSGLKATIQRLGILEELQKSGHCSIDDIYTTLKEKYPSISLATVYKNIQTLVEKRVIIEVPISGAKSKYELKKQDHIHLICQVCNSVEDERVEGVTQENLMLLAQKDSFILSRSQINLYGVCRNCQS